MVGPRYQDLHGDIVLIAVKRLLTRRKFVKSPSVDDKDTIHSKYGLGARDNTNNIDEYTGIIKALEWLLDNNFTNETLWLREIHN